jgi:hypothetical protein
MHNETTDDCYTDADNTEGNEVNEKGGWRYGGDGLQTGVLLSLYLDRIGDEWCLLERCIEEKHPKCPIET